MGLFRRKPKFVDQVYLLTEEVRSLLANGYVPRSVHEARVKELLEANTRRVEERRQMEREWAACEREALRALKVARQNGGIVKAIDWLKSEAYMPDWVRETIDAFVAGYTAQANPGTHLAAYQAGIQAHAKDVALASLSKMVGVDI